MPFSRLLEIFPALHLFTITWCTFYHAGVNRVQITKLLPLISNPHPARFKFDWSHDLHCAVIESQVTFTWLCTCNCLDTWWFAHCHRNEAGTTWNNTQPWLTHCHAALGYQIHKIDQCELRNIGCYFHFDMQPVFLIIWWLKASPCWRFYCGIIQYLTTERCLSVTPWFQHMSLPEEV